MLGLLEVLGGVVFVVFAGMVLWGLYRLIVDLLNNFVERRLDKLYEQKDRLWHDNTNLHEDIEDLKEDVWDCAGVKKKLDLLFKDVEDLEEYVLNQDNYDLTIKKLWEQRDTIYYFIAKLEERVGDLEKGKLLK